LPEFTSTDDTVETNTNTFSTRTTRSVQPERTYAIGYAVNTEKRLTMSALTTTYIYSEREAEPGLYIKRDDSSVLTWHLGAATVTQSNTNYEQVFVNPFSSFARRVTESAFILSVDFINDVIWYWRGGGAYEVTNLVNDVKTDYCFAGSTAGKTLYTGPIVPSSKARPTVLYCGVGEPYDLAVNNFPCPIAAGHQHDTLVCIPYPRWKWYSQMADIEAASYKSADSAAALYDINVQIEAPVTPCAWDHPSVA
jgi:hypothetical protein